MAGFLKGNKVELGDGVNAGDVPDLDVLPVRGGPRSPASPTRKGAAEALIHRVRGGGARRSRTDRTGRSTAGEYARGHETGEGVRR